LFDDVDFIMREAVDSSDHFNERSNMDWKVIISPKSNNFIAIWVFVNPEFSVKNFFKFLNS
jgi:hypothetical protein